MCQSQDIDQMERMDHNEFTEISHVIPENEFVAHAILRSEINTFFSTLT